PPACRGVSSCGPRISLLASFFRRLLFARHEFRMNRELLRCKTHRFARDRFRHAFHFINDASRLHDGDPVLGGALSFTHARLSRLLRYRLVREDANPDFAAALNEPRDRDTAGLDLAIGDPRRVQRLQTEVAELKRRTAPRLAAHPSALLLAVLHFLWHQHDSNPLRSAQPQVLAVVCLEVFLPYRSSTS